MVRQIQTAAFGVPEYDPKRIGYYRPKILPEHLRRLWLEKQRTRKPMTRLMAEALDEYFAQQAELASRFWGAPPGLPGGVPPTPDCGLLKRLRSIAEHQSPFHTLRFLASRICPRWFHVRGSSLTPAPGVEWRR